MKSSHAVFTDRLFLELFWREFSIIIQQNLET